MTSYKVIYFSDNDVCLCKTFLTEDSAREFATALGSKWNIIVSYVTSTTITDITTPTP